MGNPGRAADQTSQAGAIVPNKYNGISLQRAARARNS